MADINKLNDSLRDIVASFNYRVDNMLKRKPSIREEGDTRFDANGKAIPSKERNDVDDDESDRLLNTLSSFRDVVEIEGRKVSKFNVVIDYFKVEFLWKFSVTDSRCVELFRLLGLDDPNVHHDNCHGRDNFDDCWCIAHQSFILFDPNENARKDSIDDYFILEMTGQGCMAFEARGGDWLSLISWVNSQRHEAKRVDFAGDDMSGICPLDELKKKVVSRCYVSNFRSRNSIKLGNQEYVLDVSDGDYFGLSADVRDYQNGYSVTWGRKDNLQLQIYDKKAERLNKGIKTLLESTVRYEMRFGSSRADVILLLLEISYQKKCVGTLFSCLLRWLLEFKEESKSDVNHLYRVPIWKLYDELLGTSDRISIPVRQKDMEASIARARSWISNQWASTAKRLIAISPVYFHSVIALALKEEMDNHGITEDEYSQIATFLHYHPEFGKFSRENCLANVKDYLDEYCPYSDEDQQSDSDEFDGAFDSLRY